MKDMKGILSQVDNDFPIELHTVNYFPAFWGFGLEVFRGKDDHLMYGGVIQYTSSGARLNVKDYSGFINYDMLVNRVAFGPSFRYVQKSYKRYSMGAEANILISFSSLEFNYQLNIQNNLESFNEQFNSRSFQVKLSWVHHFQLFDKIYFLGQTGYELDIISDKLIYDGNSNAYLLNNRGDQARLDWSGFRLSLGIGYKISHN